MLFFSDTLINTFSPSILFLVYVPCKLVQVYLQISFHAFDFYANTREMPGVALVNILIGWIFMGKGNTHLKWNIEVVAHVEEKYLNETQFSVK